MQNEKHEITEFFETWRTLSHDSGLGLACIIGCKTPLTVTDNRVTLVYIARFGNRRFFRCRHCGCLT